MKKILAAAVTILSVWLIATYPYVMLNPGELVKGHQDLKNKCLSCHKPFWGIEPQRCITCHKLPDIGRDTMTNDSARVKRMLFHQNLKDQKCTPCHTDHKGLNVTSSGSFDHTLLSGSEKGNCGNCHNKPSDKVHTRIAGSCSSCHNTQGWKSGAAFNHNMIQGADKNNCISCHELPTASYHKSFKDNCTKCHTTNQWKPSTFDHSSYFLLDEHHNATCNTCHTGNNYSAYTCFGCHEHDQGHIMHKHTEHGMTNIGNCVSCHKSGNEHEGGEHSEHGGEGERGDD